MVSMLFIRRIVLICLSWHADQHDAEPNQRKQHRRGGNEHNEMGNVCELEAEIRSDITTIKGGRVLSGAKSNVHMASRKSLATP